MVDIAVKVDDLEAAAGKHVAATEENPVTRLLWAFDGTAYQIDLTAKNRTAFESAVKKFREASQKHIPADSKPVKRSSGSGRKSSKKVGTNPNAEEVRAWAARKGVKCPARGRVPKEICQQWEKETGHTYAVNGSEPAATGSAASPAGQGTQPASAS